MFVKFVYRICTSFGDNSTGWFTWSLHAFLWLWSAKYQLYMGHFRSFMFGGSTVQCFKWL